ncbi:MAG: hypothetical protein QXX94_03510 [Candidatus Bathyarchaeia archaeon]
MSHRSLGLFPLLLADYSCQLREKFYPRKTGWELSKQYNKVINAIGSDDAFILQIDKQVKVY